MFFDGTNERLIKGVNVLVTGNQIEKIGKGISGDRECQQFWKVMVIP